MVARLAIPALCKTPERSSRPGSHSYPSTLSMAYHVHETPIPIETPRGSCLLLDRVGAVSQLPCEQIHHEKKIPVSSLRTIRPR